MRHNLSLVDAIFNQMNEGFLVIDAQSHKVLESNSPLYALWGLGHQENPASEKILEDIISKIEEPRDFFESLNELQTSFTKK